MPEKIIHVENIGNVTLRKNKRSKNISIAIRPLKGIVVTFPHYISYRYALNVVEKRQQWIKDHLPKIESIEKKATIFDENTNFNTKYRKLQFIKADSDHLKFKITTTTIDVLHPEGFNFYTSDFQKSLREKIVQTLRKEAKQYLTQRTTDLAEKLGFKFNKIFIKNNKSLWGSCSAKNNLNFNLHLLRLPDHLIDYVIIHELCHTTEKNHGKSFWQLMDTILGNAKKLSKELKKYSIQIY